MKEIYGHEVARLTDMREDGYISKVDYQGALTDLARIFDIYEEMAKDVKDPVEFEQLKSVFRVQVAKYALI